MVRVGTICACRDFRPKTVLNCFALDGHGHLFYLYQNTCLVRRYTCRSLQRRIRLTTVHPTKPFIASQLQSNGYEITAQIGLMYWRFRVRSLARRKYAGKRQRPACTFTELDH